MESAAYRMREGLYPPGSYGDASRVKTVFTVYEDRIDAEQKFIDLFNLQPSGWHAVRKTEAALAPDSRRHLLVNSEYRIESGNSIRLCTDGTTLVPPMIVASVDAEMNAKIANRFPSALRPDNAVVVVGVVFAVAGGTSDAEGLTFERQAFVLAPSCDAID